MGASCLDVPPTLLAQLVMMSDLGDLRRAADALDCTPQLLSRSIGDLERATGSQLLVPEGDTRILGAAGQRVAEKARAALAAIDRFHSTAYEDRSTLKVAHVANADTLSVLLEQSSLSPLTRVSEYLVPDHQQLTHLRAYRLDVAVCTATPTIPDDLVAAPLRLDPLVVSGPTGGSVTDVVVPFYGLAWRAHDELTAAYARRATWQVERVSVPLGSGREHAALIRAGGGRPVVVASSAPIRPGMWSG